LRRLRLNSKQPLNSFLGVVLFESKVEEKIGHLKPVMKTLKSLNSIKIIPGLTTITAKADGEFTKLAYCNGQSYTLNRWGHLRSDFPALNEFNEAMKRTQVKELVVLCELYAVDGEKLLKLPQFIHCIKNQNKDLEKVRIGVWDLVSVDGKEVTENYAWRLEEVSKWLNGCTMVKVLPFILPKTLKEIEEFWRHYVEELKYEGIVVRNNNEIFKLKTEGELDAVIIAINKERLFAEQKVTSVKLALMESDGTFVELCDCSSGIDVPLRSALWQLMEYKVEEDEKRVWVKPMVVVQIAYTDTFESANRRMGFNGQKYIEVGTMPLVTLKSPRLAHIRSDKEVTPKDLALEQIP